MRIRNYYILLSGLLFLFACFEKQNHEIAAPEIPYYDITGSVSDIDSQELLPGIIVKLEVIQLFHDVEFVEATDTTDSSSQYLFKAMTPGRYKIHAFRNGFPVTEEDLILQYEPKIFDLALPKPLVTDDYYSSSGYGNCDGIHWKYVDKMARIIFWKQTGYADNAIAGIRIDEGNFSDGFEVQGAKRLRNETPPLEGLAFLTNYWAAGKGHSSTSIYAVSQGNSEVKSEYDVPYDISDLTCDNTYLWASTPGGHILKFDGHPGKLVKDYLLTDEKLGGIAWDKSAIWTGEINRDLLIKRNSEMGVERTYRLIHLDIRGNHKFVAPLSYMAFDFYGNLWVSNSAGYYKFKMPDE